PEREQFLLRRVARRVFALRRVGKFALGTEHMAMRIDRARRRPEFRLRRIGVKGNIPRAHRHKRFSLYELTTRIPSKALNPTWIKLSWWDLARIKAACSN